MNSTHKYIIFEDKQIYIFDTRAIHSQMAGSRKVKSAGFLELDPDRKLIKVYGESTTLGKKMELEDYGIIERALKKEITNLR